MCTRPFFWLVDLSGQTFFPRLARKSNRPRAILAFLATGDPIAQSALFISSFLLHPYHLGPRRWHPRQAECDACAPLRRLSREGPVFAGAGLPGLGGAGGRCGGTWPYLMGGCNDRQPTEIRGARWVLWCVGAAFFLRCLSWTLAPGLGAPTGDRWMGIGAVHHHARCSSRSNALYPVDVMPRGGCAGCLPATAAQLRVQRRCAEYC